MTYRVRAMKTSADKVGEPARGRAARRVRRSPRTSFHGESPLSWAGQVREPPAGDRSGVGKRGSRNQEATARHSEAEGMGGSDVPGMLRPGPHNAITDVAGVKVGHFTHERFLTGTTVVLVEGGAVAGVDVRGAAPGTRETDLLAPENLVQHVHGVVLTGGSAYGLDAAGGVVAYLEERGIGFPVGQGR